jgi:hypothetical protein
MSGLAAVKQPDEPAVSDGSTRGSNTESIRRAAARDLTELLERNDRFSFLRLGDGEIQCITAVTAGKVPPRYRYNDDGAASVEAPFSVSGIEARRVPALLHAYKHCSFLDYCDSIPAVRNALPTLAIGRTPEQLRNSSPDTSNIIFEWTAFELRDYLLRHRCLIASAESALLAELCGDPRYRKIAAEVLPRDKLPFFHQVRDNGRRFSENLDLIREDLRKEIKSKGVDTLMLSLAGGAKILCHELAEEMSIRCIDFGSMPRALTYSGTPGYHTHRSFHNPFLFRIPIDVYLEALERAHPQLTAAELLAKAQAQLVLELYDLKPFCFNNSEAVAGADISRSPDAFRRFWSAYPTYRRLYRERCGTDPPSRRLHADFVRWRRKKGIGIDGKVFLALVGWKRVARTAMHRLRPERRD